MKRGSKKPARRPSRRATRPASKGRRDFALWTFIVTVLAWLFPDPLRLLWPRERVQQVADTLRINVQETIPVRDIELTAEPGIHSWTGTPATLSRT